jgi:hypothetical protein
LKEFFMNIARLFRIIATIAALVAVALGMGTYTLADFTTIHMLFGLIVALALLILSVIANFNGLERLGVIGIVYAFIVPIFGITQQMILVGDLHWLVETAHLAVGFGALVLIGTIGERFTRRKAAAAASTTSKAA